MVLVRNPGKLNMLRLKLREIKYVAEETLGNQKSSVRNPGKLNMLREKPRKLNMLSEKPPGNSTCSVRNPGKLNMLHKIPRETNYLPCNCNCIFLYPINFFPKQ